MDGHLCYYLFTLLLVVGTLGYPVDVPSEEVHIPVALGAADISKDVPVLLEAAKDVVVVKDEVDTVQDVVVPVKEQEVKDVVDQLQSQDEVKIDLLSKPEVPVDYPVVSVVEEQPGDKVVVTKVDDIKLNIDIDIATELPVKILEPVKLAVEETQEQSFGSYDQDGDGYIDIFEWEKKAEAEEAKKQFENADSNDDDKISQEEYQSWSSPAEPQENVNDVYVPSDIIEQPVDDMQAPVGRSAEDILSEEVDVVGDVVKDVVVEDESALSSAPQEVILVDEVAPVLAVEIVEEPVVAVIKEQPIVVEEVVVDKVVEEPQLVVAELLPSVKSIEIPVDVVQEPIVPVQAEPLPLKPVEAVAVPAVLPIEVQPEVLPVESPKNPLVVAVLPEEQIKKEEVVLSAVVPSEVVPSEVSPDVVVPEVKKDVLPEVVVAEVKSEVPELKPELVEIKPEVLPVLTPEVPKVVSELKPVVALSEVKPEVVLSEVKPEVVFSELKPELAPIQSQDVPLPVKPVSEEELKPSNIISS